MPFRAKVNGYCVICQEIILPGTVTTPIRIPLSSSGSKITDETQGPTKNDKNIPPIQWAHHDCISSPDDIRIPICKHWKSKGICIFQSNCQFRHPITELNTTTRSRNRHGTWGRKRIYNEGRASALRRWLLNIFPLEYLQSGSGILDIAGGKGELSFELVNLNNLQSTIIDPRPLDLYRYKRKLQFGFYHRNEMLECYNPLSLSTPPSNSSSNCDIKMREGGGGEEGGEGGEGEETAGRIPRLPTHIRGYFEMFDSMKTGSIFCHDSKSIKEELVYYYPLALQSSEEFLFQLKRSQQTKWTKKGLQHENEIDNDPLEEEEQEENEMREEGEERGQEGEEPGERGQGEGTESLSSSFSNIRSREMEGGIEIVDYEKACDIVRNCSIVVGMHPDQAVEHLIDFALLNNKPFAVVPCCVYHKQFPHRHVSSSGRSTSDGGIGGGSGGYVRRYGELIEYLLQKDPSIKALEMDFEGKNILLYSLGPCQPLREPVDEPIPHICRGPATSTHWWRLSNHEQSKSHRGCGCSCVGNSVTGSSNKKSEGKRSQRTHGGAEVKKREVDEEILSGFSEMMFMGSEVDV